ncbi:hypothetical protein ZWY2020_055409 [Hordeum vulgare]|nr:hypothetical protein ZWY2020_055409 [Hordeum vulgare]
MASVAASSSPLAAASLAVSRRPHHALPPARGPRPQAQAQALRAVSGPAGSRRWGVRRGASVVRAVQGQDTTIQVPDVTKATWQSLVIESEIPVLVEFWASWCGPCKMIDPVIGKLSKEYEGKLKCYKLNTDENPDIASQYGVRSIPTMMIFKNGEKKDAVIGAVPESTLITCIEKFTERPARPSSRNLPDRFSPPPRSILGGQRTLGGGARADWIPSQYREFFNQNCLQQIAS